MPGSPIPPLRPFLDETGVEQVDFPMLRSVVHDFLLHPCPSSFFPVSREGVIVPDAEGHFTSFSVLQSYF